MAKNNNEIELEREAVDEPTAVSSSADLSTTENKQETEVQVESENSLGAEKEGIGFSQEIIDEKMQQVLETQNPKKKKKSIIVNLILLAVNLIFMFFTVRSLINKVGDQSFSGIIENQGNKLWWLAGGVGIYVLYILAQMLMYVVLIKEFTKRNRPWLAYDVAVVGKYYDNITPFAVGGQPMQIVRLTKNDVTPGVATSIPIIKMIINNAVNVIIGIAFFIFGIPLISGTNSLHRLLIIIFEVLGVIGLVIYAIAVIFMFLLSSGRMITRSTISGILRLGYKMKIVKNYRKTFKKLMNHVAEYKLSMHYLWTHKLLLLKMILLSVVECLTYAVIPYFVVMAFAPPLEVQPVVFLFMCITEYYICQMASNFIPLPGGTGIIEIAFIFLFGIVLSNSVVVWALLAWRFLSYYIIIIHGFVHEIIQIIHNFRVNGKTNEKKLKKEKIE
ncbi:MAG: flippase-like domain-containing protein [Clostridia bacterium]|nr:flippase-like domain-containing protein [Clostridia bacterium]